MNETILENVFSRRQQRRRNSLTCVQILTQKQFSNRTTTQSLIRKRIRVNQLRRKMHYEMNQQEEEQDHSMMTPQPLSNQPQQQLSPVGSLIASSNQMSNVIPSHSQPPTLTISDQQQQPLHLSQIKQVVSQFFESLLQSKETLEGKKSLPMTAQEKEKIAQEIISTPILMQKLTSVKSLFHFESFVKEDREIFIMVSNVMQPRSIYLSCFPVINQQR